MAVIDQRGFVDDGSQNLSVRGETGVGNLSATGVITSSLGSWGQLTTFNNQSGGQTLANPTLFYQVTQWMTASLSSPGVQVLPSASNGQANNTTGIIQPGMYLHHLDISFSGSSGTYTFALFENGVQDPEATIQSSIASGQPFPVHVTINDLDYHVSGTVHDLRVKCSNAGANFQMNYGSWSTVRQLG